jgi:hypothetical protein
MVQRQTCSIACAEVEVWLADDTAAAEPTYEVTISNSDPTQAVTVAVHIDGHPAKPPDIICKSAAAPYTPLASVAPAEVPAASAVICSVTLSSAQGDNRLLSLSAIDTDGEVLDEVLLKRSQTQAGARAQNAQATTAQGTLLGAHWLGCVLCMLLTQHLTRASVRISLSRHHKCVVLVRGVQLCLCAPQSAQRLVGLALLSLTLHGSMQVLLQAHSPVHR